MDSIVAIHCITRGGGPWMIQSILRHIRDPISFNREKVFHIYREENQVADSLFQRVMINDAIWSTDHSTYIDRLGHLYKLTDMDYQTLKVYRLVFFCIYFLYMRSSTTPFIDFHLFLTFVAMLH